MRALPCFVSLIFGLSLLAALISSQGTVDQVYAKLKKEDLKLYSQRYHTYVQQMMSERFDWFNISNVNMVFSPASAFFVLAQLLLNMQGTTRSDFVFKVFPRYDEVMQAQNNVKMQTLKEKIEELTKVLSSLLPFYYATEFTEEQLAPLKDKNWTTVQFWRLWGKNPFSGQKFFHNSSRVDHRFSLFMSPEIMDEVDDMQMMLTVTQTGADLMRIDPFTKRQLQDMLENHIDKPTGFGFKDLGLDGVMDDLWHLDIVKQKQAEKPKKKDKKKNLINWAQLFTKALDVITGDVLKLNWKKTEEEVAPPPANMSNYEQAMAMVFIHQHHTELTFNMTVKLTGKQLTLTGPGKSRDGGPYVVLSMPMNEDNFTFDLIVFKEGHMNKSLLDFSTLDYTSMLGELEDTEISVTMPLIKITKSEFDLKRYLRNLDVKDAFHIDANFKHLCSTCRLRICKNAKCVYQISSFDMNETSVSMSTITHLVMSALPNSRHAVTLDREMKDECPDAMPCVNLPQGMRDLVKKFVPPKKDKRAADQQQPKKQTSPRPANATGSIDDLELGAEENVMGKLFFFVIRDAEHIYYYGSTYVEK